MSQDLDKPYREVTQQVYECFLRRKSEDAVEILKSFVASQMESPSQVEALFPEDWATKLLGGRDIRLEDMENNEERSI